MKFVDGSCDPPPVTSLDFADWYTRDQMLLSWINATLSMSALPYAVGLRSAREAWIVLTRRFGSITPAHIMTLRKQLHHMKKDTLSMAKYLQQFKSLADQLAASGSPVNEDDLIACVLDGLPSVYRPFTSSIRA